MYPGKPPALSCSGTDAMTKKLLATPLAERVRAVVFHRRVVFGVPFAWLLLFFLLPFALVLKISLTSAVMAIPPYEPVFRWVDNTLSVVVNFGNYLFLASDSLYKIGRASCRERE